VEASRGRALVGNSLPLITVKSIPIQIRQLITNIKNKLTDLCRNRLFQNDLTNTLSELRTVHARLSAVEASRGRPPPAHHGTGLRD
jgi:hypothetical protein